MKQSSPPPDRAWRILQKNRQTLLKALRDPRPLLIGTVYDVLRRCGNPSCHCKARPTHKQTLLLYTHRGKRHCRFVRQKDVQRVRMTWERYQKFRKALRGLRAINQRERQLLLAQMKIRAVAYDKLI